jgi:hypothetical protein
VIVKELLESFVGKVNTQLFKTVMLEDFKTGNIENTNEKILVFDFKSSVNFIDNPKESTIVDGF